MGNVVGDIFLKRLTSFKKEKRVTHVPVWYMRQAGRYHKHYQEIKKRSDFMTMCKNSDLAAEVTMGPILDFNFDAAILFSDLLFPLEHLGMGLSYESGPPTLSYHLKSLECLKKLQTVAPSKDFYNFQKEALQKLKGMLPQDKTLLGFVGSPFTLYTYSVEGSHSGNLIETKKGLFGGLFQGFTEKLMPELLDNMKIQAAGGADAVAIFDTAAGELSPGDFYQFVVPLIKYLAKEFKKSYPEKKLIYYSKHTNFFHLETLEEDAIDVLGIDWRLDMPSALKQFGDRYYLQGNIDPCWLHLPWNILEKNLKGHFNKLKESGAPLNKLIFGLGHGVLIGTPEENVRKSVELIHELLTY